MFQPSPWLLEFLTPLPFEMLPHTNISSLARSQGSSSHGRYGATPHPPYVEEDEEDEDENKFITRDTCYHLLKLYCKRSHRLERLLSPSTSTALQLDFRLR